MYNRYLQNEDQPYTPAGEPVFRENASGGAQNPRPQQSASRGMGGGSPFSGLQNLLHFGGKDESGETFLRRILSRFHLEDVDTGDLILLILLFFLLEEKADDELLIALGLLLIL